MWTFTQDWYGDRLDPDYSPASIETLQALLDGVGLTDAFWNLTA